MKPHQSPSCNPVGNLWPQPGNRAQAVWVKGPGAGHGLQTQGCVHIHTKEAGKWQEEAVRHRALSGTLAAPGQLQDRPALQPPALSASSVASNETPPASRWVWAGLGRLQSAHLQGSREGDFSLAGVQVLSVSGTVSKENRLGLSQDVFLLGLSTLDLAFHDPGLLPIYSSWRKLESLRSLRLWPFLWSPPRNLGNLNHKYLRERLPDILRLLPAWTLGSFKTLFGWCMGRDNKSLLWRQINPGLRSTYSLIKGWDFELTV